MSFQAHTGVSRSLSVGRKDPPLVMTIKMTLCVLGTEKEPCQKMEKDGSTVPVSSQAHGGAGVEGAFSLCFEAHVNSVVKFPSVFGDGRK